MAYGRLNPMPDLLTVAQVADELDLSVSGVHYRILRGSINAEKYGGQYLITRAELDDALDRAKAKTA
jgi:excisionase family DNA binding protein